MVSGVALCVLFRRDGAPSFVALWWGAIFLFTTSRTLQIVAVKLVVMPISVSGSCVKTMVASSSVKRAMSLSAGVEVSVSLFYFTSPHTSRPWEVI